MFLFHCILICFRGAILTDSCVRSRVRNKNTMREKLYQLIFFWFCFKTSPLHTNVLLSQVLKRWKKTVSLVNNRAGSLVLSNKYKRRSFLQLSYVFLVFCVFMRKLMASRCWPTKQIFALSTSDLDIYKWCLFKRLNTDSHRHSESAVVFVLLSVITRVVCASRCNPVRSCDTFGCDADPVQVSGELLRDVGLPSGRQSHHHDHGRGVGELRHRRCNTHTHSVKTPVLHLKTFPRSLWGFKGTVQHLWHTLIVIIRSNPLNLNL